MGPLKTVPLLLLLLSILHTSCAQTFNVTGSEWHQVVMKVNRLWTQRELAKRSALNFEAGKEFQWKVGDLRGDKASSFRSFDQSYVLMKENLYRLDPLHGNAGFKPVHIGHLPGETDFVESISWEGLILLVTASQHELRLYRITDSGAEHIHNISTNEHTPVAAEFFVQDGSLFLAVIFGSDSDRLTQLKLYFWTGTGLDEKGDEIQPILSGPTSLSVFSVYDSVLIVVGVKSTNVKKEAGLNVFQRQKKLNHLQFLPSSSPAKMQHFKLSNENYLLVTSEVEDKTTIYWWNGFDLVEWGVMPDLHTTSVAVGNIGGNTVIALGKETVVDIYRPGLNTLDKLHSFYYTGIDHVHSVNLGLRDGKLHLVLLLKVAGLLHTYVSEINVVQLPPDYERAAHKKDPLLRCLAMIKEDFRGLENSIEKISSMKRSLLFKNSKVTYNGKLILKKAVLPNGVKILSGRQGIGTLRAKALVYEKAEKKLRKRLRRIQDDVKEVAYKSEKNVWTGQFLVSDDAEFGSGQIDSARIDELNGQPFNPSNLLMNSRDQNIHGPIETNDFLAISLEVNDRISSHRIEDLVTRRGNQVLKGVAAIPQLTAGSVSLGTHGSINQIQIDNIVNKNMAQRTIVDGKKIVKAVVAPKMIVNNVNEHNFDKWINSLVPTTQSSTPHSLPPRKSGSAHLPLKGDVYIDNLYVDKIDGVHAGKLLANLFLKGIHENIIGDIKIGGTTTVTHLSTEYINDVPVSDLFTKTTNQIIPSLLEVTSIQAPNIDTDSVNGLNIKKNVAHFGSPKPVKGTVQLNNANVYELKLPKNFYVSGEKLPPRVFSRQIYIYNASVTFNGTVYIENFSSNGNAVIVNGQRWRSLQFRDSYLSKTKEQDIHQSKTAPNGLTSSNLIVETMNDVKPEDLVHVKNTRHFRGVYNIHEARIKGNLIAESDAVTVPVNPEKLSQDVVKTHGKFTIHGQKTFHDSVEVQNLHTKFINDREVNPVMDSRRKYLGKSYEEIWISGNLKLKSTSNFVNINLHPNLCQRIRSIMLTHSPGHVASAEFEYMNVRDISLTTINGLPIETFEKPGDFPIIPKLLVNGNLTVPMLNHVTSINGKAFDKVTRAVDSTEPNTLIRGQKHFTDLDVKQSFSSPDYDGVHLEDLKKVLLSKTKDQDIPSHITMDKMTTKKLYAPKLNDIESHNLLLSTDAVPEQTINGDVRFIRDIDVPGNLVVSKFSQCDPSKVLEKLNTLDGRTWSSVTAGNLYWKKGKPASVHGLGFFMNFAVTKDSDQDIVGQAYFDGPVHVEHFSSELDINDISLANVQRDSLRKSPAVQVSIWYVIGKFSIQSEIFPQNIYGEYILKKPLEVSSNMTVRGHVNAKVVNRIDIPLFNESLVRGVNGPRRRLVRGHKRFIQGFDAAMLKVQSITSTVDGELKDWEPTQLSEWDAQTIPILQFQAPLVFTRDLSIGEIEGFEMKKLLEERVTLNQNHEISGDITFTRDLTMEGGFSATKINDVMLEDVVVSDSAAVQSINGKKIFKEPLRVIGSVEVEKMNAHTQSIKAMHRASVFKDKDADFVDGVVFANSVTVNGDVNVEDTVNDVKISELAQKIRDHPIRDKTKAKELAKLLNSTNAKLEAQGDLSEFLYLEVVRNISLPLTLTRQASVYRHFNGELKLDLYGDTKCDYNPTCVCPTQVTLSYQHDITNPSVEMKISPERSFTFEIEAGLYVRVVTNTTSYSERCTREDWKNEFTQIEMHVGSEWVAITKHSIQILGYVRDVKLMTVNNKVYLVLGLSYDPDKHSHKTMSRIIRLDIKSKLATAVAEFETVNVGVLHVVYTLHGAHIVATSYDLNSKQSKLLIYSFNSLTEEVELIQELPYDRVTALASVVQGERTFLVTAQDQHYHVLHVLEHFVHGHPDKDHYHTMQELVPNLVPIGLGVFYLGEPGETDAFLAVSTEDLFHLFKYNGIEGFQSIGTHTIPGARALVPFRLEDKLYILVTSASSPAILQVVMQGV